MKLHASGEDYLETILVLQKKLGMVRSVDVARHLEVSKPSVSHAVTILKEGGFLTMDDEFFLHLTDVGREVAEKIYDYNHLREILGLSLVSMSDSEFLVHCDTWNYMDGIRQGLKQQPEITLNG